LARPDALIFPASTSTRGLVKETHEELFKMPSGSANEYNTAAMVDKEAGLNWSLNDPYGASLPRNLETRDGGHASKFRDLEFLPKARIIGYTSQGCTGEWHYLGCGGFLITVPRWKRRLGRIRRTADRQRGHCCNETDTDVINLRSITPTANTVAAFKIIKEEVATRHLRDILLLCSGKRDDP
jgi:hypothetical protein